MTKRILFFFTLGVICVNLIFISFWLNLSSRKLTPWLEFQANSRLPSGYAARINQVSTRPWGLRAEKIKLTDSQKKSELLFIDSLEISFNILSLILYQSLPYKIEIYEGEINGALKVEGLFELSPRFHAVFSGDDIEPNRNPVLRKTDLIVSNPVLSMEKARINLSPPLAANFTLKLRELKIGGVAKYFKTPFELPETDFKSLEADLSVRDKKIQGSIKSSGDISGKLKGTVLRDPRRFKDSKLDLVLRISAGKKYWSKLDFFKDIIKTYFNKSKQIHIKILGSFGRPKVIRI